MPWLRLVNESGGSSLYNTDLMQVISPARLGGAVICWTDGDTSTVGETVDDIEAMLHPTTPACDDLVSDIDAALILLAEEAGDGDAVVSRAIEGLERVRSALLTHQ